MKIKWRAIQQVIPYERNPRRNADAVDSVAASIKEFGWQQPIVVDAEGVIIVGHTRLLAAQALGLDKVPVVVADDLSAEQARAYRLADNKLNELASWDAELLKLELETLQDYGFDIGITGFNLETLASELAEPTDNITRLPPDPDPEPTQSENSGLPRTSIPAFEPMDIIDLGPHNLTVGYEELGLIKKIIKLVQTEAPKLAILRNGEPIKPE